MPQDTDPVAILGPAERAQGIACPVCRRLVSAADFVATPLGDIEAALVAANAPGWRRDEGLCRECLSGFTEALRHLRALDPTRPAEPGPILPTPLRLGASDRYTGRGVTIAFLDSGFYAHADLGNRILAYKDVTNPRARPKDLERPSESAWHGLMTSVVACGDGSLSRGVYRGLASRARLVLVKCGTLRRIAHDDIRRGLDWVVRNRRRYGIRIVNVSCGGDYAASYLHDSLSQAAEEATREGILVCAAIGNLGQTPGHPVLPPASAPSVLTVGGLDDKNQLDASGFEMYHSSYGPTLDGLQKPEVIAPGIWVAAPILPGTPTAEKAQLLSLLGSARNGDLRVIIASHPGVDPVLDLALGLEDGLLRRLVDSRTRSDNVISGAYKHVDGTSFAAPIVSSVAAQMLEAQPRLTPQEVKLILIQTAHRLPGVAVERQGAGVVDPRGAMQLALAARRSPKPRPTPRPNG